MVFKVLKGLMGLQRLRYGLKYCYDNPWVGLGLCAKCGGCQPSSVCKKGKHTDRTYRQTNIQTDQTDDKFNLLDIDL